MALSIQEIIQNVRVELARASSPLANFSPFSNIGTIITSIATIINTQENKLDGVYANLFLETTAGTNLDLRAFDFGLSRLEGRKATGSVIIKNLVNDMPRGTIFTEPNSNIQFFLLSSLTGGAPGNEKIAVIEASSPGTLYNLPAGAKLVSSLYPNLQISIGRVRNSVSGQIEGSLVNGTDRETDEELRFRIREFLKTRGQSTPQSIVNAIDGISGTGRIFLVEHTPVTGYFTVFIESRDVKVVEAVERTLDVIKPAGVVGLVKSLEQRDVDAAAVINVRDTLEINRIRTDIRRLLNQYMSSLTIADTVSVSAIAREINNVEGVMSSILTFPSSNIVLRDNELPSLGKLTLRFTVS